MADRHKRRPRAVRLGELDDQVVAYAGEHERTVNSVITEAVRTFLGAGLVAAGTLSPGGGSDDPKPGTTADSSPTAGAARGQRARLGYSKERQARGKR